MNRLPSYNSAVGPFERMIYASLAVAAFTLVGLTLADAIRFSRDRDDIVTSLSRPMTEFAAILTNHPSTNLTSLVPNPMTETSRFNNVLVPKS